jgi:hypothetical protein
VALLLRGLEDEAARLLGRERVEAQRGEDAAHGSERRRGKRERERGGKKKESVDGPIDGKR